MLGKTQVSPAAGVIHVRQLPDQLAMRATAHMDVGIFDSGGDLKVGEERVGFSVYAVPPDHARAVKDRRDHRVTNGTSRGLRITAWPAFL